MALPMYIPLCISTPPHPNHPPPVNKPLRIAIQGPLQTIQRLDPEVVWHPIRPFPQPGGVQLARITHQALYGQGGEPGADAVRDEYLAWVSEGERPNSRPTDFIDYYGVTFDYLVEPDDLDPEVLTLQIIEVDKDDGLYGDGGTYANEGCLFPVDPTEYTGKKVLTVPRCCQNAWGKGDRKRINGLVKENDEQLQKDREQKLLSG